MQRHAAALFVSLLSLSALVLTTSRDVSACSQAPSHSVTIEVDDSPGCIDIEDEYSYDAGALLIHNQCQDTFTLEDESCEACSEATMIEPGESGRFVLDYRTDEASDIDQHISWSLGERTGTLMTLVSYRDNSDACDDWEKGRGCQMGSSSLVTPWLVAFALLALRRRRPLVEKCA